SVPWQFLGSKVRVRDQRRCVLTEPFQRVIDRSIAKLVVGGVHDVTVVAVNAIRECSAGMIQRLNADTKSTDVDRARADQRYRRTAWQVIEGHRKIRRAENRLNELER